MLKLFLEEYKQYHLNAIFNPIQWIFYLLIKKAKTWEKTSKLMKWNYLLHMSYLKWDKDSKDWYDSSLFIFDKKSKSWIKL